MTERTRIPTHAGKWIFTPDVPLWFICNQTSAPAHVTFEGGYAVAVINCVPCQGDSLRGTWEYVGPWDNGLEEEE